MTLRKDKCEFGVHSVLFLGPIVSDDGVKPVPGKVRAIIELSAPTNKNMARRRMGMLNYLSKFINRLSELWAPIFPIIEKVFDNIKGELSSTSVLCAFHLTCKHRVSTDSSHFAELSEAISDDEVLKLCLLYLS